MTGLQSLQFVEYLRQAGHLKAADAVGVTDSGAPDQLQGDIWRTQQSAAFGKLWESPICQPANSPTRSLASTNMTVWRCRTCCRPRLLIAAFSQRFLRETLVFPYRKPIYGIVLVIADPTDLAARRAAEIVLGRRSKSRVASFDDLTVVLDQRLAGDNAEGHGDAGGFQPLREDDIESLRDLASAHRRARGQRSPRKSRRACARATSISSRFRPGSPCACASTACCGRSTPLRACSRRLSSPHQDHREPQHRGAAIAQDGAARLRAGRADIDIRVAIMPLQHGEAR